MRKMTPLFCAVWVCAAAPAGAEETVKRDGGPQFDFAISAAKTAGGYMPALVARPEGDARVKDIPSVSTDYKIDFSLRFQVLSFESRVFGLNSAQKSPSVVGMHYGLLIAPFRCKEGKEIGFDKPWEGGPCASFGLAHRSAHNLDDGTYNGTVTNDLLLRYRLLGGDGGKTAMRVRAAFSFDDLETPFALTPSTDIPAAELERRKWQGGISYETAVAEDDAFWADAELRASDAGAASFGIAGRYLHRFIQTKIPLRFGAELGFDYNLRKADRLGASATRFLLLFDFPLVEK